MAATTVSQLYDNIYNSLTDKSNLNPNTVVSKVYDVATKLEEFNRFAIVNKEKQTLNPNSEEFKNQGNRFFQKKKYLEAVNCYTKYIFNTVDHANCLSIGLANRSAALFKLENYTRCLDDIEAALKFGYPKEQQYQLYDRRAECFKYLNDYQNAIESYEQAIEILNQSTAIESRLKEIILGKFNQNREKISLKHGCKTTTQPTSELYPKGLSKKIKIKYEEKTGRSLHAVAKINPGEVILCEDPIVTSTLYDPSNKEQYCHHCLEHSGLSPFPSMHVPRILFCSWKCFKGAHNSYHEIESILLTDHMDTIDQGIKVEQSGNLYLGLKGLVELKDELITENRDLVSDEKELYVTTPTKVHIFDILQRLVCHENVISDESLISNTIRSTMMLKCIRESSLFKENDMNRDKQIKLIRILNYLQLAFQHNIHAIYSLNGEINNDIPLTNVGSGLYQCSLYVNHSCAPNTSRFYDGKSLVLIARRTILPGQEITDNYGMHHYNLPRDVRREKLKLGYKFDCECEACRQDYPPMKFIPTQIKNNNKSKQLSKFLSQYQTEFTNGNFERARNACEKYIGVLEQVHAYPHRNYEIGYIALNSCIWGQIAKENGH